MEKHSQPISKMENCQRTLNLTTKEMQERNEREGEKEMETGRAWACCLNLQLSDVATQTQRKDAKLKDTFGQRNAKCTCRANFFTELNKK